jgi:hypothetical protein
VITSIYVVFLVERAAMPGGASDIKRAPGYPVDGARDRGPRRG